MIRARIAPTPSGYLHAGNAFNFVLTWLSTRTRNGSLLLRIDDLDSPRTRREYLDDIFHTLEWLGLDWDEGPQSVEEHVKQYSQSLRKDLYEDYVKTLIKHAPVFACKCSRKELQNFNSHTCLCRAKNIPLNTPDTALRMHTPRGTIIAFNDISGNTYSISLTDEMPDFIIRRRDGIAAYQLASLADDEHFKINLILRGNDLLNSTAAQLYLSQFLPHSAFNQVQFHHHTLLKDDEGKKLSKSAGSLSIKNMREHYATSEKFYLHLGKLLGWKTPVHCLTEMLAMVKSGEKIVV